MTKEDLLKENRSLRDKVLDQENDIRIIAQTVFKTLQGIGLKPEHLADPKEAKKTVMKSIGSIAMDATVNPDALAQQFSHLKDLAPLLEKYQHIIKETAA